MARPRILFVSEAVTLAHVARPAVLARSLAEDEFEVLFAASDNYDQFFADLPFHRINISSITSKQFLASLSRGRPLHDVSTLRAYVAEDMDLIRNVEPDVVVGDLRHSLGVAARKSRVPYVSIVSAYWSPGARARYTIPEHPAVKLLGLPLADSLFKIVRPFAFASHARPVNTVRKEHGLPALPADLLATYNDADYVVYPDVPELVPVDKLPRGHSFVGPLLWSPAVPLPSWWNDLPEDRPLVYVTMGSSGSRQALHEIVRALASEPVTLLVASGGNGIEDAPRNVFQARYLPGDQASAVARVVICNGGSPTAHQAFASGRPVLGVPSNMDQHLNMFFVEQAQCGLSVRADLVTPKAIRAAVHRLLNEQAFTTATQRITSAFRAYDVGSRFSNILRNVIAVRQFTL